MHPRQVEVIPPRPTVERGDDVDVLLPLRVIATEFRKRPETIRQWVKSKTLGFPPPTRINGRFFFSRHAIEVWKRSMSEGA
jgi:hypothetical protein